MYNKDNIFAKIISGQIPTEKIYEDDHVIAFNDINPQASVHILVIPKAPHISFDDFAKNQGEAGISAFFKAVRHVAHEAGVSDSGYRIITNHGSDGGQEVPHFHVHILGGEKLGKLVTPTP